MLRSEVLAHYGSQKRVIEDVRQTRYVAQATVSNWLSTPVVPWAIALELAFITNGKLRFGRHHYDYRRRPLNKFMEGSQS